MPRKRKKEKITCRYFTWLVGQLSGVWQADGRSNSVDLGRHSLRTRDYEEAKEQLHRLDLVTAVERGLADRIQLEQANLKHLPLTEGSQLYLAHAGRPAVVGGVRASSLKRYRAVFAKFQEFAKEAGTTSWNQVTDCTLEEYATWMENREYSYHTQYLELTTLKQAVMWFIQKDRLPADCRIVLSLPKPQGTSTYCWKREEVQAMLNFCLQQDGLNWLRRIILGLALTGLRISELANLRWSDIDLGRGKRGMIQLVDETTQRRRGKETIRSTKSGRNRSFPIHTELRKMLLSMHRHIDGYVFHGSRGGRLKADTLRRILIRDVLEPLAEQFPTPKDEVGFRDGRLHSFRHFFCSLCANSGVSVQAVMHWLGHKESRMVQHYYHLHDEEAHRQMGSLRLFDDLSDDGAAEA